MQDVFGVMYAADSTAREALEAVAREFSPRIEVYGAPGDAPGAAREIALDLSGLTRLFGDARAMGQELRRTAADRGLRVRVAIAATRTAARLLVHHRAGVTIVEPGTETAMLAPLPVSLLDDIASTPELSTDHHPPPTTHPPRTTNHHPPTETLRRWGVRTLGEFAALPSEAVAARLGQAGVEWQRRARGDDPRPLVAAVAAERFEQALDLEWPIEGLEPLSFVLGRLMEPLEAHLARRDRGAAVLHVRLHLVTRTIHARSLQLPAPMRDARALRTLALLDLESHPPAAAIDRVVVAVDPTPGRIVQFSLLTRALPSPERLSTLTARLAALMGAGRCGSPAIVDSWEPGAFTMQPFAPREASVIHTTNDTPRHPPPPRLRRAGRGTEITNAMTETSDLSASVSRCVGESGGVNDVLRPTVALRRFRVPVPARVRVEAGRPVRVTIDRRGMAGGRVERAAGPWRTSGAWWVDGPGQPHGPWDRDEWDVALSGGATYRIFRARLRAEARRATAGDTGAWFVDGVVD